jgi:hypothetical protein
LPCRLSPRILDSSLSAAFSTLHCALQFHCDKICAVRDADDLVLPPKRTSIGSDHHEPRPDSLIQQFYAFQKPKDQTIHDACAYLQNLGYKISQSDPSLATLLDEKRLIQRLLSSLPAEYDTLVDIIDPKTDLPPDILIRLATKERRLATTAATAIADPYKLDTSGIPKGPPPAAHYTKRSIKGKNKYDKDLRCYLCREEHHLQDCPTRKTLLKMARAWELNYKKGKRSAKSNEEGEDDDNAAIAYSSSDLSDNEAW